MEHLCVPWPLELIACCRKTSLVRPNLRCWEQLRHQAYILLCFFCCDWKVWNILKITGFHKATLSYPEKVLHHCHIIFILFIGPLQNHNDNIPAEPPFLQAEHSHLSQPSLTFQRLLFIFVTLQQTYSMCICLSWSEQPSGPITESA